MVMICCVLSSLYRRLYSPVIYIYIYCYICKDLKRPFQESSVHPPLGRMLPFSRKAAACGGPWCCVWHSPGRCNPRCHPGVRWRMEHEEHLQISIRAATEVLKRLRGLLRNMNLCVFFEVYLIIAVLVYWKVTFYHPTFKVLLLWIVCHATCMCTCAEMKILQHGISKDIMNVTVVF